MDNDIRIISAGLIILDGQKHPIPQLTVGRNQAGRPVQLSIFLDEHLRSRLASERSVLLQFPHVDGPIRIHASECPSCEWDRGRRMTSPGLFHLHTTRELNASELQVIDQLIQALEGH